MNIVPQILVNGIIAGGLYALIALGFNVIYRTTKFFDLSYGSIIVLGGYGAYLFKKVLPLPVVPGIVLSVIFGGIVAWVVYRLVYVPLGERKASNSIYLVASLGVFTVIQALVAMAFSSQFQTVTEGIGSVIRTPYFVITTVQLITVVGSIIATGIVMAFLRYSRIGTLLRAIADEREVAEALGIQTRKIIGYAFMIGGAIAALSGVAIAYDVGVDPYIGFGYLLKGVIAAIVGGVGSIHGGFVGGMMLGIIENIGVWQLSAQWKDLIAFLVLIIFLVVKPRGMFSR